jgi:general secretion pathway protein G
MSIHKTPNAKGFTLIELLVVIAIIGILSSVVLASLSTARAKSRDARRISDLGQIRLALEMYYDASSTYPGTVAANLLQTWTTTSPTAGVGYIATAYLPKVPTDPGNGTYYYCAMASKTSVQCDGNASANNAFVLGANLENSVATNATLNTDADVIVGASPTAKFNGASASCADTTTSAANTEKCFDIAN